ncbi:hypothetical protein HQH24_24775, partial [Escherichia coli]|nr:hypothetical protein [Escherichia coli]
EYLGEQGRLILTKRPSEEGLAWIKFDSTGVEEELNLENVKIIALLKDKRYQFPLRIPQSRDFFY